MIRLELHELLLAYTGTFVFLIFAAWWTHNAIRTRRERAAMRGLLRCGFCAFEFRAPANADLPRCPACDGKVERKRLSRL